MPSAVVQVRYATLCLMCHVLGMLETILHDCQEAGKAAAAVARAGSAGARGEAQEAAARLEWQACAAELRQAARQQLPDPQLLVALLVWAEKQQGACATALVRTQACTRAFAPLWSTRTPSHAPCVQAKTCC